MKPLLCLFVVVLTCTFNAPAASKKGLQLHPDNPHYLQFRGKPTLLITSGEHYGALLNLDFDYTAYFDALAADKLNGTRTFSGAYVETGGNFNISQNTLDPAPGRFICPWARSTTPGYADGGNKFDLQRWDKAYFQRLKDFAKAAGDRGVIVEMNLFCPFYDDSQWKVSPMNAANNVNGLGTVSRTNVYTLDLHGGLLAVQVAMVRKIVEELRDFDNVYYEICNEPYFGGVTMDWQHHIVTQITDAQKRHPVKKLISQNIANNQAKIEKPHPDVSIFNFHYAAPPDTVAMNYGLNKVIGDNETGFRGTNDAPYRTEAWDFIVAGGGLFNHLDYSFTVQDPRGTWIDYPANQPGGGNPTLRRQFRILREFMEGFDFVRMKPDNSILRGGVPAGLSARVLAKPGKEYALYLRPQIDTRLSVRWTGRIKPTATGEHVFHTFSNDGIRLWIDGKPVINNWTDHSLTEDSGRVMLQTNRTHDLKLEYYYNGGEAVAKLWWTPPGGQKGPVPSERLTPAGTVGKGLKGQYYAGTNFDRLRLTRTDADVNFTWGTQSPFEATGKVPSFKLRLALPGAVYVADWISPLTGEVVKTERFSHHHGVKELDAPAFSEDIALRVAAAGAK